MTTTSYPITGENITHSQWSNLFRRHHEGIDTGLSLTLSSTSDNATVTVGRAFLLGFMLEVTEDHVLTLPAVAVATTYQIGILYDPATEGDPLGPLTLTSGVKGSITSPVGGYFWPLFDVTRQPSQTLNLATVKSYRVARTSTLFASSAVSDPPSDSNPQGHMLLVREKGFKVWNGAAWVEVKDDTGYLTTGFIAAVGWQNIGSGYRILNDSVEVQIRLKRTGGTITSNARGDISNSDLITIPQAAWPAWVNLSGGAINGWGIYHCGLWLGTDGMAVLLSTLPNLTIENGHVVYGSFSYLRKD